MNKNLQPICNDLGALADDVRALVAATTGLAGDQVVEARKRITAALERGQDALGRVREKTWERGQAAERSLHAHPYEAMALAFGIGAIVGFLLHPRRSRDIL